MRKLHFVLLLLGFSFAHAQTNSEDSTKVRSNDIMLSPIELIAAPALNISYERLLNNSTGVGLNALLNFKDRNSDDDAAFSQFSPYVRVYFGKKYAAGFFVEGFVPITTTHYTIHPNMPYGEPVRNTQTTVGIGVGFGGKWVMKNNILFEASAGIGRRFGNLEKHYNSYDSSTPVITGKGMLGIGYRF